MTLAFDLFIMNLVSEEPLNRLYFMSVVVTVVVSIILHELAHGWTAFDRLG